MLAPLAPESLYNFLRRQSAEVLTDHDPPWRAARRASLRFLPHGNQPGRRLASLCDDDLLALASLIQQPGQVGLDLVNVHHHVHLFQ